MDKCHCLNVSPMQYCRLHAAAPALLEALEEIASYSPGKYLLDAHLDKARAAIAQAKGETNGS